MKTIFALALFALPSFAFAQDCHLPKGAVDFLDSRLFTYDLGPRPASYPEIKFESRIEPSEDCSKVRVWMGSLDKDGKGIHPTDQQCEQVTGRDFSSIQGLLTCTDFKVYKNEEEARGKDLPYAYVKDGTLVTRQNGAFAGGLISAVYLFNDGSGKVIGMGNYVPVDALKNMSNMVPEVKAMEGKVWVQDEAKAMEQWREQQGSGSGPTTGRAF